MNIVPNRSIVVTLCFEGHSHKYSGIPFDVTDDTQLSGNTEYLCSFFKITNYPLKVQSIIKALAKILGVDLYLNIFLYKIIIWVYIGT